MYSTNKALAMILTVLLSTSMLAVAAETTGAGPGDTIRATVEFVDAQTGLMWVRMSDGTRMKMAAPTSLLDDLQKGHEVEIAIAKHGAMGVTGDDTSAATVQKIDASTGLLRLLTAQGEIVDLRPPEKIIADLQTGDKMMISVHSVGITPQAKSQRDDQQAMTASQSQSPASASDVPLTATVESINQQASTLALLTDQGKRIELRAPGSLLSDLQEGDSVEISVRKASQAPHMDTPQGQPSQSNQPR